MRHGRYGWNKAPGGDGSRGTNHDSALFGSIVLFRTRSCHVHDAAEVCGMKELVLSFKVGEAYKKKEETPLKLIGRAGPR